MDIINITDIPFLKKKLKVKLSEIHLIVIS